FLESPAASAAYHRIGAQRMYMHPVATYALIPQSYPSYSASYRLTWSALTDTLPMNVHLLTLDQLAPKEFLVRVEHYFELNEDDTFSHPVTFNLQSIFTSLGSIKSMQEMTLAANLALSDLNRLKWVTGNEEMLDRHVSKDANANDTNITLNPMEIRTFRVELA
ncbi:unnamed protein product, partial [Adineta ricciae]